MQKPDTEKPLVTFALFAYNQERFIREAVEGALSQTYSPLEIVLSDDCSTDRTFEVIENLASRYQGPHKIILNRNNKNCGLGLHIRKMARKFSGDIVVLAAGDDISFTKRTEKIVNAFSSDEEIMAVFSDYSVLSDPGELIESHKSTWSSAISLSLLEMAIRGGGVGGGASYAYRKECFFWPEEYPAAIDNEDRLLPFRAALLGKLKHLSEPLLSYRLSDAGLSRSIPPVRMMAKFKDVHIIELMNTVDFALAENRLGKREAKQVMRTLRNLKKKSLYLYKLETRNRVIDRIILRVTLRWRYLRMVFRSLITKA